jgi:hypothetical protein
MDIRRSLSLPYILSMGLFRAASVSLRLCKGATNSEMEYEWLSRELGGLDASITTQLQHSSTQLRYRRVRNRVDGDWTSGSVFAEPYLNSILQALPSSQSQVTASTAASKPSDIEELQDSIEDKLQPSEPILEDALPSVANSTGFGRHVSACGSRSYSQQLSHHFDSFVSFEWKDDVYLLGMSDDVGVLHKYDFTSYSFESIQTLAQVSPVKRMHAFQAFGTQYVCIPRPAPVSDLQILRFDEESQELVVHQSIPTASSLCCSTISVNDQVYLAVAAMHADEHPDRHTNIVYKFRKHTQRFIPHQYLVNYSAFSVDFFTINSNVYLSIAGDVNSTLADRSSFIMTMNQSSGILTTHQTFTYDATSIVHYRFVDEEYILVISSNLTRVLFVPFDHATGLFTHTNMSTVTADFAAGISVNHRDERLLVAISVSHSNKIALVSKKLHSVSLNYFMNLEPPKFCGLTAMFNVGPDLFTAASNAAYLWCNDQFLKVESSAHATVE